MAKPKKMSVSGNPEAQVPRLHVDWNNLNSQGRIRFTDGTFADVQRLKLELKPGLKVYFDDGEREGLEIEGVVEFSKEENGWVGFFDFEKLKNIHFTNRK